MQVQTEKDVAKISVIRGEDDDEYDSEEDRENAMNNALQQVDMGRLEAFLTSVEPKMIQMLDANNGSRAFDSYEVRWEDEREDINEAYEVRTDFDFIAANSAIQTALN